MDTSSAHVRETILCFSHLRWDFVRQRPQHILSLAAREYEVWYVEEPITGEVDIPYLDIKGTSDKVRVVVPVVPRASDDREWPKMLRGMIDPLVGHFAGSPLPLWYYTPMALPFSRHIRAKICV